MKQLEGKIALVTGANSGMGKATVKALSDQGAKVIMLCRSAKRGKDAYLEIKNENRDIDLMLCDLGDFSSIHRFVKSFEFKYPSLDI